MTSGVPIDDGHTTVTGGPRACCCATSHGASLRRERDEAVAASLVLLDIQKTDAETFFRVTRERDEARADLDRAYRSLQYMNEYAPRVRARAVAWKAAASKLWKQGAQLMRVVLTQDDRTTELRTWAQSRLDHCASQDQTIDVTTERRTLEAVLRIIGTDGGL